MTDTERLESVKHTVELIYKEILLRPQLLCRAASIEAFVFALERILNVIDGDNRNDGYLEYLSDSGFGIHLFESKYEHEEQCLHTFIRRIDVKADSHDLWDNYVSRFQQNWEGFLLWRDRRNGSTPK